MLLRDAYNCKHTVGEEFVGHSVFQYLSMCFSCHLPNVCASLPTTIFI